MKTGRLQKIQNILSDLGQGFKEDYAIGKEDTTRMYYRKRELDNKSDDAPKVENMLGTHPGMFRLRELMGKATPAEQEALKEANMELRGSTAHKVGQFLGTAAADLTQDRSRSIYWLLNALQATGEVINESALAKAVPSLYETSPVMSGKSVMTKGGKVPKAYQPGNKEDLANMLKQGMVRRDEDDRIVPTRGYKFKTNDDGEKELHKRNYSQGMLAATSIPTGIAINSGLGLLSPFGGAEGYKAAIPSDEDPSKTDNLVGEVALKYIMGRTGNLLPYEEFKKVRPDVSRKEYAEYQQFKYDKREDYNPLDGDITVAAGALKATNDGIHGPEVQFLGRSLPVTTGVVPYAASLIGGVVGARRGAKNNKAALGALTGGMAGLAAGQVGGNIIEQERRRRNYVENESENGNAELYLR